MSLEKNRFYKYILLANTKRNKMLIGDEIKNAIQKAVNKAGNPYRFSLKLSGIRHTTIRDWLSGKTQSISDENWKKLYPEIKEYIYQRDGQSLTTCLDLANELIVCEESLDAYRKEFFERYKINNPKAAYDEIDAALYKDERYNNAFNDFRTKLFTLREYLRHYTGGLKPKTLKAIFEILAFECYNILPVAQCVLDDDVTTNAIIHTHIKHSKK